MRRDARYIGRGCITYNISNSVQCMRESCPSSKSKFKMSSIDHRPSTAVVNTVSPAYHISHIIFPTGWARTCVELVPLAERFSSGVYIPTPQKQKRITQPISFTRPQTTKHYLNTHILHHPPQLTLLPNLNALDPHGAIRIRRAPRRVPRILHLREVTHSRHTPIVPWLVTNVVREPARRPAGRDREDQVELCCTGDQINNKELRTKDVL